mmetsp:Transcript_22552/g.31474  ORF Transcript_22552/g.31474 Transcript_22552/m.31474 type:complete len:104 (+) Transcript_22552:28-339(+)
MLYAFCFGAVLLLLWLSWLSPHGPSSYNFVNSSFFIGGFHQEVCDRRAKTDADPKSSTNFPGFLGRFGREHHITKRFALNCLDLSPRENNVFLTALLYLLSSQ